MKQENSSRWLYKNALCVVVFLMMLSQETLATNYYINSATGNNKHKTTQPNAAWKTISPLSNVQLKAGDSILFASGQKFSGMLQIANVTGGAKSPIVVSSFTYNGNKLKPILDAGEALNAILIQNASFIKVEGLEITGEVPYPNSSSSAKGLMKCGILVEVTTNELYTNIELENLLVHDVYFNPKGFKRSAEEVRTANGTQSYGWGVRFINNTPGGKLNNIKVSYTEIYNVSHTGLKFTATKAGLHNIEVAHTKVHHTGGPGIQMSGVVDGHIHHNQVQCLVLK